jgi:acyl carrier protein phosphodiesterase
MNYLAHFYLSGKNDNVLYGNFIGDLVKGKSWLNYEKEVQKGIKLHRFIDDFIDKHPFAQKSRTRLREDFGLTSPVVLDVYYDHFLSDKWSEYHSASLEQFMQATFDRLRPYKKQMESYYPIMIEKMESEGWVQSYKSINGTAKILGQMAKRVRFDTNWHKAEAVLIENYKGLDDDFALFFPEIIAAVEKTFDIKCV